MDKKTKDDTASKFKDYDKTLERVSRDLFTIVSPKKGDTDIEKYEHVVISIAAITRVLAEVLSRFNKMDILSDEDAEKLLHAVHLLDRAIGVALVKQVVSTMAPEDRPTTLDGLDVSKATKQ